MSYFFSTSLFLGATVTILAFELGGWISKKFKSPISNQFFLAVIILVAMMALLDVSYEDYSYSAKFLNYFSTPATVCFAIPLYKKLDELKENWLPVAVSIFLGVVINIATIYLLSRVLGLTKEEYFSLIPKHMTAPISVPLSEEYGGIYGVTVFAVMISGVCGNLMAERVLRWIRIKDPVSKGVSLGSSAHSIGTARALILGETEGAMSALAASFTGIITVLVGPIFVSLPI